MTRSEYLLDLINQSKRTGNPTFAAADLANELDGKRKRRRLTELEVAFAFFHHFNQLVPDILERFRVTAGMALALEACADEPSAVKKIVRRIREDEAALVEFLHTIDEMDADSFDRGGWVKDEAERAVMAQAA